MNVGTVLSNIQNFWIAKSQDPSARRVIALNSWNVVRDIILICQCMNMCMDASMCMCTYLWICMSQIIMYV
jgi:hypothetical protein